MHLPFLCGLSKKNSIIVDTVFDAYLIKYLTCSCEGQVLDLCLK